MVLVEPRRRVVVRSSAPRDTSLGVGNSAAGLTDTGDGGGGIAALSNKLYSPPSVASSPTEESRATLQRGSSDVFGDNAMLLCAHRRQRHHRNSRSWPALGFWKRPWRRDRLRRLVSIVQRPSWSVWLVLTAFIVTVLRQVQLAMTRKGYNNFSTTVQQHHHHSHHRNQRNTHYFLPPQSPRHQVSFRLVFASNFRKRHDDVSSLLSDGMLMLLQNRQKRPHHNDDDAWVPVSLPDRDFFGPAGPDFGGLHFDSMQFWTERWYRVPYSRTEEWYEEERHHFLKSVDADMSSSHDHWEEMTGIDRTQTCHRLQWVDTQHQTCNLFHELHLGREPVVGPLPSTTAADGEDHHHHGHRHRNHKHPGIDVTQPYSRRYLSHGYFRDSWLWEPVHSRVISGGDSHSSDSPRKGVHAASSASASASSRLGQENFVLKALRLTNSDLDYGWWTAHHMFKEALVMERTTASPRTMNIYGHCYTSHLVEQGFEISQRIVQGIEYRGRGRIKQEDLDALQANGTLASFNEFSAEEKLEIATAMAEAIAEMHGNAEGVIVNDDVHPDQFLVNRHGQVKFNDMNNAHILEWNPANSSYCKWPIWIGGDYRSPEEMRGEPIDEKSDVWPMGALIFGLLTGLFPYYTVWDTKAVEKVIASGEPPYLDPRWKNKSYIEGRMVEIMERCFADKPEDRASIFEVVLSLRETAEDVVVLRSQGKVDWSTKPAGLVPEVSIPSPEYEMPDDDGSGDDGDDRDGNNHDRHSPEDTGLSKESWAGLSERVSRVESSSGTDRDTAVNAYDTSIHLVDDDSLEALSASSIRAGMGAKKQDEEHPEGVQHHDDGKPAAETVRDDHVGEEQ